MMNLTDIESQLAEIESRAEKATTGPWICGLVPHEATKTKGRNVTIGIARRILSEFLGLTKKHYRQLWPIGAVVQKDTDGVTIVMTGPGPTSGQNIQFIAASRADVPKLCSHIRALIKLARAADRLRRAVLDCKSTADSTVLRAANDYDAAKEGK